MIIICNNVIVIENFKEDLSKRFYMKDLGELIYFMGVF